MLWEVVVEYPSGQVRTQNVLVWSHAGIRAHAIPHACLRARKPATALHARTRANIHAATRARNHVYHNCADL